MTIFLLQIFVTWHNTMTSKRDEPTVLGWRQCTKKDGYKFPVYKYVSVDKTKQRPKTIFVTLQDCKKSGVFFIQFLSVCTHRSILKNANRYQNQTVVKIMQDPAHRVARIGENKTFRMCNQNCPYCKWNRHWQCVKRRTPASVHLHSCSTLQKYWNKNGPTTIFQQTLSLG